MRTFSPGDVAGQFTAASPTCPGDTFTFRCNVTGDMSGETTWRVDGSSQCILVHTFTSSPICGPSDVFRARSGTGFGMIGATLFSSTLSGTAFPTLNDTLVECFGPANNVDPGNRVGSNTLQILGQYHDICFLPPPKFDDYQYAKMEGKAWEISPCTTKSCRRRVDI